MKALTLALVGGSLLALGIADSQATEYYDYENINLWVDQGSPITGREFNIAGQGYDSTSESIVSANIEFVVWDSDANLSGVTITVGGAAFASGSIAQGFTIFDGALAGQALYDFRPDGTVGYSIALSSGDRFLVSAASIIVQTAPNSVIAMPDGGTTVALLGLGLVGLEWGRRRIKR